MKNLLDYTGKPLKDACNTIALFINADGFRKKDGTPYTGEDIFNCNPHGELSGVFTAVRFLYECGKEQKFYNVMGSELTTALVSIQNGEDRIIIDAPSGIGRACCGFLWRCPWDKKEIE